MQLFGNAVVTREPLVGKDGSVTPQLEFRGEFLHAFIDTERVQVRPAGELTRGSDRFTADTLDYDNLDQVAEPARPGARPAGAAQRQAAAAPPSAARSCAIAIAMPPTRSHAPLVFITGASSGIGQALASRYHQAGWRLALVARRTAEIEAWASAAGHRPSQLCRSTAPTWPTPTASWPPARPASRSRACPTW